MKVSSLPNLNRETTSFPNFFTLFQHPADHHHHDTALQIHEHSCDTEASETSPYKAIRSPSISFDETNEIGFLAGTNSVGVFRSESENDDRTRPNSVSVGSNQFGGSEWPKLPSYGGTSVTSPISQETIEQPISPLCPTKRAFTQIHTFQFLEIKEATMTEAGTSKSSRSETPAPLPPFSKSFQTAKGKGIDSRFTSENLQQYFGHKRKDVAALLGVSKPPDQHGEGNISTARETPSLHVQTGMGSEPVGQNQEANVLQRDFMGGPIAWNPENSLIIGSSSEWASQVNDQSTLFTPYPNHDALVYPSPQITSMLSDNWGGSIDWRNSLASQAEPFSDRHISGSSNLAFPTWSDQAAPSQHAEGQSVQSTVYPDHNAVHRFPEGHVCESINWNEHINSLASQAEPFSDRHISGSMCRPPDQLEGQTTQLIAHQNPNAPVFPQFQIASTQVLCENEDRRNSLAFLMGHVSESSNLAFPAYSDATSPIQFTQSTSHPNPNVVVPQEPQIASTQTLSENMGSLENWEEFLSLEEETSLGGHVSGSVNLTGTTCCDPSPSQQPVLTNCDMMPTTHVMSHLVAKEDERSVTVKVSYRDRTIKLFQVPLTSRIIELKEEVKKRLKLEPSNFDFEYKDEDDGDWIFLGCDEDLTNHLQLFSNRVIRLLVVDSDASTKNI